MIAMGRAKGRDATSKSQDGHRRRNHSRHTRFQHNQTKSKRNFHVSESIKPNQFRNPTFRSQSGDISRKLAASNPNKPGGGVQKQKAPAKPKAESAGETDTKPLSSSRARERANVRGGNQGSNN